MVQLTCHGHSWDHDDRVDELYSILDLLHCWGLGGLALEMTGNQSLRAGCLSTNFTSLAILQLDRRCKTLGPANGHLTTVVFKSILSSAI